MLDKRAQETCRRNLLKQHVQLYIRCKTRVQTCLHEVCSRHLFKDALKDFLAETRQKRYSILFESNYCVIL